ncbi:serine protease inhibitor [Synechococcus sp. CS-1331]|nr:serine protease inhibitor [Synechococcus sp. CS-1331]
MAMAVPAPLSSPLSTRPVSGRSRPLKSARHLSASGGQGAGGLAVLLLLLAVLVAPERPQVQEAICQRHNGVEACRVW